MPRHGDLLPFTTDAGYRLAAIGVGRLDLTMRGLITRQRSWPGLVAPALVLGLGSVVGLAGARSVGVSHSFRGTARAGVISATLTSATRTSPTSTTSRIIITTTETAAGFTEGTASECRVMPGLVG